MFLFFIKHLILNIFIFNSRFVFIFWSRKHKFTINILFDELVVGEMSALWKLCLLSCQQGRAMACISGFNTSFIQ